MTIFRIRICDACEELLLGDTHLYEIYQAILCSWSKDEPYIGYVFHDGTMSTKYLLLEASGLITSTECGTDKVQILPRNCPHIK